MRVAYREILSNLISVPSFVLCHVINTLFFISLPALSQQKTLKFDHLTIEQGLSQSSINSVIQDSKGFMWFGTQDGLNRFDGYSFTVFKHDPLDSNTISNNFVHHLYDDRMGSLWIGTDKGLDRLDLRSGKFTHFLHFGRTTAIYADSGLLWIGTSGGGGLYQFYPGTSSDLPLTNIVRNSSDFENSDIKSILKDRSGSLWIGTSNGLYKRTASGENHHSLFHSPSQGRTTAGNRIYCMTEDKRHRIWIGTNRGITRYDPINGLFEQIELPGKAVIGINSILQDSSGAIWAASDGGLYILYANSEIFSLVKSDAARPYSLNSDFLSSLFQSTDGTIWIGSFNQGINKYNPHRNKFIHYAHDSQNANSLSNNDVWAFCEDHNGNIWVATDAGLNHIRKSETGFEAFSHFFHDPADPQSLIDNRVWSLFKDRKDNIWIGTDGGLSKISKNQIPSLRPKFINYVHNSLLRNTLVHDRITVIREDRNGLLWIGTSGGISIFDTDKESFVSYQNVPDDSSSLSHNRILSLFEDRNGAMWIGTSGGGLNKFEKSSSSFIHYLNNPSDVKSLGNNRVTSIYQDSSGIFWIGTLGGGLNRFNEEKREFINFTEKDGLPNNAVYGIVEDRNGYFWISTNKGISRFSPRLDFSAEGRPKGVFRNYSVNDGLQSSEFNSGSYFQSKKGGVFFGGINGFNVFEPNKISDNPHIPPTAITYIKRLSKNSDPIRFISDNDRIELSYRDQGIAIEFASLDYTSTELNRYAYMMEGFDKDWNYSSAKHDITYTNLDQGEYIFRVKGSNHDQVWNEIGTAIHITVTPPFWKSLWFRILILFGVIITLQRTYKYRTRKFKRKNSELERLVLERTRKLEKANLDLKIANERIVQANEMKSRFLANMSHELRTPLNSIIGFSDLLIQGVLGRIPHEQEESLNAISSSSKSLLRLINDVLDLSKVEAGKMTLKRSAVHLDEIVHNSWHMMVPLFEQKKQSFEIVLPQPNPVIPIDENKIKQVLINLLSNSSKFTPLQGKIRLTAQLISYNGQENDHLEIRISDSGKGIRPDELETVFEEFRQSSDSSENQGTGLGLALSKRIIELHGGKIWAESDGKTGTEFIFHLPLNEKPIT